MCILLRFGEKIMILVYIIELSENRIINRKDYQIRGS